MPGRYVLQSFGITVLRSFSVMALQSWNNEFVYCAVACSIVYNTIICGNFIYNRYIIQHTNDVNVRAVLLVRT